MDLAAKAMLDDGRTRKIQRVADPGKRCEDSTRYSQDFSLTDELSPFAYLATQYLKIEGGLPSWKQVAKGIMQEEIVQVLAAQKGSKSDKEWALS